MVLTATRKKKREGFAVPYGTDLLLEPYGFATIQILYNVSHKTSPRAGADCSYSRTGMYPFLLPDSDECEGDNAAASLMD